MSRSKTIGRKNEKKQPVIWVLLLMGISLIPLGAHSYFKIKRLDLTVVQPTLDPARTYERSFSFKLGDPFISFVPFWIIFYAENPTDVTYTSPAIAVDLFGRIVSAPTKEVWTALENE